MKKRVNKLFVLLLAMLAVPLSVPLSGLGSETNVWQDWVQFKTKSLDLLSDEQRGDATAFLYGIRLGFQQLSLTPIRPDGKALPRTYPHCDERSIECSKRRKLLEKLGDLTLQARVACVLNPASAQQRPEALDSLLQELDPLPNAGLWMKPLRTWRDADTNAERCDAIVLLLQRALDGSKG